MRRGEVVEIEWHFSDLTGSKVRPAVVVQADFLNGLIDDTVLVKITGQREASYEEATQLRFPGFHPDDLEHVRESFRSLHSGSSNSGAFDARIVRPDGETRWIRVSHHLKVGKGGRWLKAVHPVSTGLVVSALARPESRPNVHPVRARRRCSRSRSP